MKYYKDNQNNIFAYELDGSQDHLIEDKTPITKEEVDVFVEQKRQEAFDALPYTKKRAAEYPNFIEYLDGLVKGDQTQIQTYIDACNAVKAKYPKGA